MSQQSLEKVPSAQRVSSNTGNNVKASDCPENPPCTACMLLRCKTNCPSTLCTGCTYTSAKCSVNALLATKSPGSYTASSLCRPPSPVCPLRCPPSPTCPPRCPPSSICSPRCPRCCIVTSSCKLPSCCPPSPRIDPCCPPRCPPPKYNPCCPPPRCPPPRCDPCCPPPKPSPCCPPPKCDPCCPPKPCCPPPKCDPCCPPKPCCPPPCCPPPCCPPPCCPPCEEPKKEEQKEEPKPDDPCPKSPPPVHRCPSDVETERPKYFSESITGPATWEAYGVRINNTVPVSPGTSTVKLGEPLEVKLSIDVKASSCLSPDIISAYCWTHMKTNCNPCGTWKDLPLHYQPDQTTTGECGVRTYHYASKLVPSDSDTFRLTFNIKWANVLVWANNFQDDNMVKTTS